MFKHVLAATAAMSMAAVAVPAGAQTQGGLVNVNLGDISLENIANDLNVEVSQIPVNVQVPIAVAANICGVAVNVLAVQRRDGPVNCDAVAGSEAAVTQVLQKRMSQRNQNR